MRSQTPITVRFDPDVWRDLKAYARATEIPLARIVNAAVRRRVEVLVDAALPEVKAAYEFAGGKLPGPLVPPRII